MFRLVILTFMPVAYSAGLNHGSKDSYSMADWMGDMIALQRGDDFEAYLRRDDVTMSDSSRSNAVVNLAFHIACWLGKNTNGLGHIAYITAKFGRYACWCGFGGSGRTMDKIDVCCKAHDVCLDRATQKYKKKNWSASIAFSTKYTATCHSRRSYCKTKKASGLARAACKCDRTAGYCINRYRSAWRWWRVLFARMDC